MTMSSFLRLCREQAGFSQEELADLLDTTQSTISKIERGRKEPGMYFFKDWTRITNAADKGYQFIGEFIYGLDPASLIQSALQATGAA